MAKENRKKNDVKMQRMVAVAILIAACVLIVLLTGKGNQLEQVSIVRLPGNYLSVSDDEIIRASGLKMGAQIGSIAKMKESVASSVNSTGCVRFEDMRRVSNNHLEITVSPREAIAVINSAGNYVLIDRDGYVMDILKRLPTTNIIFVSGAEILAQEKGRMFATYNSDQLKAIIDIALAVNDGGYQQTFCEMNVNDIKKILLITNTSQIIEVFDVKDIRGKLDRVYALIKQGYTKDKIIAAGEYVYREQFDEK